MKRHHLAAYLFVLAVGSTGIVVACSSDSSTPSGSSGTSGTTSGTTTVHVSAAAGGTVADPSGKTSLNIPPGALEKDTDITLAIAPASAGSVVEVSEFGPDGLKFLKPVTLTIKADAALATGGKVLALATLDGAAFKAVEGSAYANGAASAPITHFSKYSIILVDGKAILVPPKNCVDAIANFKPCGGDIKGTWTFADFCIPGGAIGQDPFQGKCPEFSFDGEFKITSEVVIDATTIKQSAGDNIQTSTLNVPLKCANSDGDGGTVPMPVDCAGFQTNINKNRTGKPLYACTDKGGGICACTVTETKPTVAKTSTYTTSGNSLTTTDDTGKMGAPIDYCVNSNLFSARAADGDGGTALLYILNRKP